MTTAAKHRRDRVTAEILVTYHTAEGRTDLFGWRWRIWLIRGGSTYAAVLPYQMNSSLYGYTSRASALAAARKLVADMGLDVQAERVFV